MNAHPRSFYGPTGAPSALTAGLSGGTLLDDDSSKEIAMQTMKVTSKRQVTLPVALCEELGITAGSRLRLDRRQVAGKAAWVLQPAEDMAQKWFGRLQPYAKGQSHDLADIRASIARHFKRGEA